MITITILNNTIPTMITSSNTVNQVNIASKRTSHNSASETVNNEADVSGKGLAKDVKQAEEAAKYSRVNADNMLKRIKDAEKADNKYAGVYNKKGSRIDRDRENKFSYEKIEDPYKAISKKAYELTYEQEKSLVEVEINQEIENVIKAENAMKTMIDFICLVAENRILDTLNIKIAYQKGFDIVATKYKENMPSLMLITYWMILNGIESLGEEENK